MDKLGAAILLAILAIFVFMWILVLAQTVSTFVIQVGLILSDIYHLIKGDYKHGE